MTEVCSTISGVSCNFERVTRISGRDRDYILDLEKNSLISQASGCDSPAVISEQNDKKKLYNYYLEAKNCCQSNRANWALSRLVELSSTETEFASLAKLVPKDGGALECYYLRSVCEFCAL